MAILHIGSELRRFGHGKLPIIGVIAVILLPLIFGGLFVWAYFDPIGGLHRLPVALVNSDRGAQGPAGEQLNAGDAVVDTLLDSDQIRFVETTAAEARQGINDGTYYFGVELPKDFSEAATSIRDENPRSATVNVAFNNNNGFMATTLGNQVTATMVDAINAQLGTQVTSQLLVGYSAIGDGLSIAAEGAGSLADGTGTAHDGAQELVAGSTALNDGIASADDGASELAAGALVLDTGIGAALDGSEQLTMGLEELSAATELLGSGAGQVSTGVNQVAEIAGGVSQAQTRITAPLVGISAQLRSSGLPEAVELADRADAAVAEINQQGLGAETLSQLTSLQNGAAEIAWQLGDPASDYRAGLDSAVGGSHELAAGLQQLKDGSTRLVIGTNTLAEGTSQLVGGSRQLQVGATALRDGLIELDNGANGLSLRLSDAAATAPRWEGQRLDDAASAGGSPAERTLTGQEMTLFGVGLTPFFLSLSMFMGATVMFMLVNPLQRRAVDSNAAPLRVALASYLPAVLIGFGQATAVWFVLQFLIGLDPAEPGLLWLAAMGVSATFVALTQAINTVFGPAAGRIVCLLLMSLQLVSSGGLYPAETQPAFLQWVHTWDPMTFSVNLFRQLIIGPGDAGDPRLAQAAFVLGCILIGGLAVSSAAAWFYRVIPHKDLHPELSL